MARSFLQRQALFARHRYRWIFAGFALVVALAAFLASRLEFDADILNLLPRKDPAINSYLEVLEDFGTFDYLMVTVRIPQGAPVDPYQEYADLLAERLGAMEEIERVDYRIGEIEELLAEFFPQAFLFLDPADREALLERMSDQGIAERVQELRRLQRTPQALAMKDLIKLDPFGLSELFIQRLEQGRGSMAVDWTSGYFLSKDQELLLLLAKPTRPPQDIAFDRRLVAQVDGAVEELKAEWSALAGPDLEPPVVKPGGAYVTALEDASNIQGDMTVNILSSGALVLLLFLFAFRRLGPLAYAFFPLACGLVITFGFSAALFGVVSSATSGTAALLIGLGIDFIIVSYGRFVEERRRGADLETALETTMDSSGRAVLVGGLTTAATFYAFTFTDFTGLRQMGILTGTGILFCMVAVLLLLPAMLAWSEDHHAKRRRYPRLYLHSFGTSAVIRASMRHPKPVLLVGFVLTAVAGTLAMDLDFRDNWREMRPEGNRGIEVEQEVAEHFDSDFDFMMLVVEGPELGPLLERTEEVAEKARTLVDKGILNAVNSVASIIPPLDRQDETLSWLAERQADGSLAMDRIRPRFAEALAAEGMRAAPFEQGLDLFAQAVEVERPLGVEDFAGADQAKRLLDRMLHRKEDGWKSVVYLYPPAEVYRRSAPVEAELLAAELGDDVLLTGANVVNKIMRERIKRDAWIAAALGTFVVALFLWFDFRHLRAALLALVPLGVGIIWMLGAMVLGGIDMNFMNIFVTTMVIGIGVDYGLHMVHRYREARRDPAAGMEKSLVETGNAIVIAALSTTVGFGSLALSHYPGLRSTGLAAILGALATAVVAITLLPAYLSLRVRKHQRREGP